MLIGNFLIAGLTALVPILCGIHFYLQIDFPTQHQLTHPAVSTVQEGIAVWKNILLNDGTFVLILAYFAFTLNLSREIIKDIEDMEGDKLIFAKTLPLSIGVRKSSWIASFILLMAPVFFLVLFFVQVKSDYMINLLVLLPLAISSVLNVISVAFLLPKKVTIRTLKNADFVIKIAMLSGIIIPFYWWFMM